MAETLNRLQTAIFGLGVALIMAAIYQFYRMAEDARYNRSMQRQDFVSAEKHRSDYGRFSAARLQHSTGAFEQAHNIFASIDLQDSPALRIPVLFYLADNYVEQAVVFEQKGDDEQRVPLLELAKENYRKILHTEPDNWSVRVNLARVLRMLPDARLRESDDEDIMPERSPQAPVQTMGYDRLP